MIRRERPISAWLSRKFNTSKAWTNRTTYLQYIYIYILWIQTPPEKVQIIPQTRPKKVLGSMGKDIYKAFIKGRYPELPSGNSTAIEIVSLPIKKW